MKNIDPSYLKPLSWLSLRKSVSAANPHKLGLRMTNQTQCVGVHVREHHFLSVWSRVGEPGSLSCPVSHTDNGFITETPLPPPHLQHRSAPRQTCMCFWSPDVSPCLLSTCPAGAAGVSKLKKAACSHSNQSGKQPLAISVGPDTVCHAARGTMVTDWGLCCPELQSLS